jgi:hypothetical protein
MTGVGKLVHVKALVSFMDIREGDESVMELDATLQGWLDAGFVKVVGEVSVTVEDGGPGVATLVLEVPDGEDQAGSGSAEPDDAGSKQGARRRRR